MGCPRPNTPKSNSKNLGELERRLRDRLYTMFLDAPGRGLVLVSGYRDPGSQWDLRRGRVPRGQECNPAYRGSPLTAVPYASKHQKRTAADIGGRDLYWAMSNCWRYGLYRAVPSENWHYEVSSRAPSVRIYRYPGWTWDGGGGGTPPPHIPPVQPPEEDFFKMETARAEELFKDLRGRLDAKDDQFKDLRQRTNEVEAKLDRLLKEMPNVARKAAVVRDPRDNRVWVIGDGKPWHVPNGAVLNALVFTGQVANPGDDIPHADPVWLDDILGAHGVGR